MFGNKEFFPGKIVLITKNDAGLNVYNGDVGFVAYDGADEKKALKVFIPSEKYGILKVSPIFLKHYESGFAMTVHKSQGSEYEGVVIPLTGGNYMIMTRNLLYTAVTRARRLAVIVGTEETVARTVNNNYIRKRYSLLKKLLVDARRKIDILYGIDDDGDEEDE